MSGKKFDQEKPDMSLLSPFALEEIAKVMTYGKQKYGANNWRSGLAFSRLIAAVLRHVNAYQKGEMVDPETGLSHLAHASCGLFMMLEFEATCPALNDLYHCNKNGIREMYEEQLEEMEKGIKNIMNELSVPKIVVESEQLELPIDPWPNVEFTEQDSMPKCPVVDTYKQYTPKMQP
jgi:hypothetical protein